MTLELFPETLAVCRLSADADYPTWLGGGFRSVTRTPDELSVVCDARRVPEEVQAEGNWRYLRVAGTLEFHLTGILASLTAPLAEAKINVFALSTFDTDYLLVKGQSLEAALDILKAEGHEIRQKVTT